MEAVQYQPLSQFLAKVPDPCRPGMCDHNLLDILIIAVCAVICGADEWQDIEDFGRCKEALVQNISRATRRHTL